MATARSLPLGLRVWSVDSHAHDPTHWRNDSYHFVQRTFR
jgi:hypothetical protein